MSYLYRLLNWIRSAPNRREIDQLNNQLARVLREREVAEVLWRNYEKQLRDVEFAENNARAQLCHLRVSQNDVRGRTGYSVCAFIPTEVIETIRLKTVGYVDSFTNVIAHELVRRALRGAFHVNSRGKVSALLFGYVPDHSGGHYEPCSALFDSDQRPTPATPRTPQPNSDTRCAEPGYVLDVDEELRQRRQLNHGS